MKCQILFSRKNKKILKKKYRLLKNFTQHVECSEDKFRNVPILHTITKTCLYNFDPFKPHFYIVKLGFTGVYIIFLISAQKHRLWVLVRTASTLKNIDCGYSLEPPRRGGSNEYPQSMF